MLALLTSGAVAYANDTDPTAPATAPATTMNEPTTKIEKVDLFFDTNSATLKQDDPELTKLANWAKCDSRNAIILEGHADRRGTRAHNLTLSGERAATVRQKLIDKGVPSSRIVVSVYGKLGNPRPTLAQERRVTARAASTPVTPEELSG